MFDAKRDDCLFGGRCVRREMGRDRLLILPALRREIPPVLAEPGIVARDVLAMDRADALDGGRVEILEDGLIGALAEGRIEALEEGLLYALIML